MLCAAMDTGGPFFALLLTEGWEPQMQRSNRNQPRRENSSFPNETKVAMDRASSNPNFRLFIADSGRRINKKMAIRTQLSAQLHECLGETC